MQWQVKRGGVPPWRRPCLGGRPPGSARLPEMRARRGSPLRMSGRCGRRRGARRPSTRSSTAWRWRASGGADGSRPTPRKTRPAIRCDRGSALACVL